MICRCPYCDHAYKLADNLRGQKARCKLCRNVFVLADWEDWLGKINPAPTVQEIKAGADRYDAELKQLLPTGNVAAIQLLMQNRNYEYSTTQPEIWAARKSMPADAAFAVLLPEVALRHPVPHMYEEFVKVCRALNKEDMKKKRWSAALWRLVLMIKLDEKQNNLRWNCILARGNPDKLNEKEIREHYSMINATDRKNLDKCKAEFAKLQEKK